MTPNGWNIAFQVPQDGQGLANLYGGRQKLASKLDTFFSTSAAAADSKKKNERNERNVRRPLRNAQFRQSVGWVDSLYV
ncbi:glycoside hydrolase family 92 protein [Terrilactibacillus sp. S3-3]|nr:glycoside hydrolase family 92 protein [Terrilactibacillus sp. S3-3]